MTKRKKDKKTTKQKDNKAKRQKDENTKNDQKKRQKYKRPKREFNIVMSGQFPTVAMFVFVFVLSPPGCSHQTFKFYPGRTSSVLLGSSSSCLLFILCFFLLNCTFVCVIFFFCTCTCPLTFQLLPPNNLIQSSTINQCYNG